MKTYYKKTLIIFLATLMLIFTVYLTPKVIWLTKDNNKEIFMNKIHEYGVFGFLLLIIMNGIQVILAILPGEIFEIISGLMYGPWLGLLAVEAGIALGSFFVIFIMKLFKLNTKSNESKLCEGKLQRLIKDSRRLEVIIFFITLMPCIPKDFIVYVIPFTNLKIIRFLLINAVARIPSIITSTYFGFTLINGNYIAALVIFLVQLIIALIGLLLNKKIVNFLYKVNNEA